MNHQEEQDILASYENDEWVSVSNTADIESYKMMAKNTPTKEKYINIKITEIDFERIQQQALIEGLSYQTFMANILHKYITGSLKET